MKISVIFVFLALVLVSVFQFNWVRKSAISEISRNMRTLGSTLNRALNQTFQQYGAVIDPLFQTETSLDRSEIEEYLSDQFLKNRASGNDGNVLSAVSYVPVINSREGRILIDPVSGWQDHYFNNLRYMGEPGIYYSEKGSWENSYILIRSTSDDQYIFLFIINTEIFFKKHLHPLLEAIIPEYEISLSAGTDSGSVKEESRPDFSLSGTYEFSPFRILAGRGQKQGSIIRIRMPRFIPLIDIFSKEGLKELPFLGRPFIGVDNKHKPVRTRNELMFVVKRENGSLISDIEKQLMINWLGSMALLTGIGFVYFLVILRAIRLNEIRNKEREFTASITHELRTPLTVIQSAADNLKKGIIPLEKVSEYGNLITNQSRRLNTMIEGLLLFSRLEGKNEQHAVLSSFNPGRWCEEIRETLNPLAESENCIIDWDLKGAPPEIHSDPEIITFIISNLVANALYHAYPGDVKGKIIVRVKLPNPDKILFFVEDDGEGISFKEQKQIFKAFIRSKKSMERQIKGSGLGLYLARRKAAIAGGQLLVESPYERADGKKHSGSRFILILNNQ